MKEKNYPHLENVADLLWLSQFTGMQSVAIEEKADKREKPKDNKPKIEDNEPNSRIEEPQNDLEVHTDKQEDNSPSHSKQKSAKAIKSPKKLALDHYREWERAFKFINLKTLSKNRYELDEEKTVENIASLKVFDLVFGKVEEKSFFLTLVIDQSETMELWRELIKNFEKMLMTMGVFARISLYYWNTKNEKPRLYADKALKREVSEKVVVSDGQRNLVWVMSDCIAPAWKSGETFKSIERWATKSFTSILQMFPKRMWMGTILFKGKHIRLSSNSFNPLNKKLQTKPSKRKRDALKIPIISFDPYSLQAWAKVVVSVKGNSISGIELKNLEFTPIQNSAQNKPTPEMRMKRFYSQASPIAQKLAFYMSVLPVDFQVTRILQEERLPQSNQAHVAEVFLGGLIERTKKDSGVYYDFYPKIREELNANISADKSFEIMEDMSDFVSSHLGIGFDFKALLADPNGAFEGEFALSDESLAYARLASGVLKRKGGKFYEVALGIDKRVEKLKTNKKSNIKISIVKIETSKGYSIGTLINYNNIDNYNTVVTTKHSLIDDNGDFLDIKIDNEKIDLNKINFAESADLAILKVKNKSIYSPLKIEKKSLKTTTKVSIISTIKERKEIYHGEILNYLNEIYEIRIIGLSGNPIISKTTNQVMSILENTSFLSGSPVINSLTNKVIGIVSMIKELSIIQAIPITELWTKRYSWNKILENEEKKPYFKQLQKFLENEKDLGKSILPPKKSWFNALNLISPNKVKVVILGQDPYPKVEYAHGLAFSVLDKVKPLPKSLQNIYKELLDDLDIDNNPIGGNLQKWAKQGVLLLNSVLTVEEGKANSHQNKGWEQFTDRIIEVINNERNNVVFILWGSYAQKKGSNIDTSRHLVIKSPHPSPLSAYRGFLGSKPFSKIDKYLDRYGIFPIEWNLNPKIVSGELSSKQIIAFKNLLKIRKEKIQDDLDRKLELKEIELALDKINDNLYGICEMCEEPIDINRLKVKIFARYCITCREVIEKEMKYKVPKQLTVKLGEINNFIIDREKELDKINKILNDSNILLITGSAGIGKTTIASQYLNNYKDTLDYYGFFRGLDSFIDELRTSLRLKEERKEDALNEALSILKGLEGNKLLVLDEIIDVKRNSEIIDNILSLKDSGYKIIMTSREKIERVKTYYLNEINSISIYQESFENMSAKNWESFALDFLNFLGYKILKFPLRGADNGIDGVVEYNNIKYIVSCKYFTNQSVGIRNENNITDRMYKYNAKGFIGFYSTLVTSSLLDRFNAIEKRGFKIKCYDRDKINIYLRKLPINVLEKYGLSNNIDLIEHHLLKCMECNINILDDDRINISRVQISVNKNRELEFLYGCKECLSWEEIGWLEINEALDEERFISWNKYIEKKLLKYKPSSSFFQNKNEFDTKIKIKQQETNLETTNKQISKTQIDGEFNGWEGETIIKLINGELWQQSEYYYEYFYAYMPNVTLIKSSSGYSMQVEGTSKEVGVIKLNNTILNNGFSDVIDSKINGEFNGWDGETIFKLMNGQIWQQSSYAYHYSYKFMPKVTIYKSGNRYKMKVKGVGKEVFVKRIS